MKDNQIIFLGGIESGFWIDNGKRLSRNYHQGYRVYSSEGVANTIPSSSIGGLGGNSGLYLVREIYRQNHKSDCSNRTI